MNGYEVSDELWAEMQKDTSLKARVEKFAEAHGMKVVREKKKSGKKIAGEVDAVPATEPHDA